jgi:hypothetical protein
MLYAAIFLVQPILRRIDWVSDTFHLLLIKRGDGLEIRCTEVSVVCIPLVDSRDHLTVLQHLIFKILV